MNGFTERRFAIIKEGALSMLLKAKINDTAQKILWEESVHTCKLVRNSMATTCSTTRPFRNFYGEKNKIIGSFLEFGRIGNVTKQDKFRKKMTNKTFKAIMVVYSENHTRYMYKFYNPETKRVIMTRDVKWEDWKMTDPAETLKMFRKSEKEYLVPVTEEEIITTSEPEDKITVHVIPDEGERVRPNEISENSSELTYLKIDADKDTLSYNRVLNALKKLDTSYSSVPWVATTSTWARARSRGAGLSRTHQNTATCPV